MTDENGQDARSRPLDDRRYEMVLREEQIRVGVKLETIKEQNKEQLVKIEEQKQALLAHQAKTERSLEKYQAETQRALLEYQKATDLRLSNMDATTHALAETLRDLLVSSNERTKLIKSIRANLAWSFMALATAAAALTGFLQIWHH